MIEIYNLSICLQSKPVIRRYVPPPGNIIATAAAGRSAIHFIAMSSGDLTDKPTFKMKSRVWQHTAINTHQTRTVRVEFHFDLHQNAICSLVPHPHFVFLYTICYNVIVSTNSHRCTRSWRLISFNFRYILHSEQSIISKRLFFRDVETHGFNWFLFWWQFNLMIPYDWTEIPVILISVRLQTDYNR